MSKRRCSPWSAHGVSVGVPDGVADGVPVGVADGDAVGVPEGVADGVCVGVADGEAVGVPEGVAEGVPVGVPDGVVVGVPEGVPAGVGLNSPLSRRSLVFRTAGSKTNGLQPTAFTDADLDEETTRYALENDGVVSVVLHYIGNKDTGQCHVDSTECPRSFSRSGARFPHLFRPSSQVLFRQSAVAKNNV